MPLGQKPSCSKCSTEETLVWHKLKEEVICHSCFKPTLPTSESAEILDFSEQVAQDIEVIGTEEKAEEKLENDETQEESKGLETRSSSSRPGPKSSRKGVKGRNKKTLTPKGRGRRTLFKKQPIKAPASCPAIVTNKSLMFKGIYYQVGDIVSVLDEDGGIFYAQIRGLLQDQYCEKSAVLTWLLPTQSSPPPEECFDPATYIIGPEEELPRKLEYLDFVMHAPNNYYRLNISVNGPNEAGYVWTNMGPVKRKLE